MMNASQSRVEHVRSFPKDEKHDLPVVRDWEIHTAGFLTT
jgi:hypothetical protein